MGFLVYLLPLVLAIGLGVAQFDAGKRALSWAAELGLGPGNEVAFGDFSGSPFDLRLDDLTIRDAEGVWLDLDDFRFSWAPSALFRGRLAIEDLSVASLTLERMPEAEAPPPEPEETEPFEIPGLPTGLLGVAVDRLAVEKLTLGAALLGERTVFAVDGRLRTTDPREQFALALRLERQDEPTARLAASASLDPREGSAPVLTVDLEAEETGGLIAAVAGTPPGADLVLSLKGTAPVTDWRGRLAGAVGGFGRVGADLALQAAADLSSFTAAADGTLGVEPRLLPEGAASLLDPETRFVLRLQRPAEGDRLVLETASITTGAASAEAEAQLDLAAQTTEGSFHLNVPALAALEELANTPLAGALAASGRFSGPLNLPEVTVDLTIDGLQAAGVSTSRLTGKLQLAALAEPGETSPESAATSGFRFGGGGRIENLAVKGAPLREPEDFVWALDVDLPAGGSIGLHQLSVTSQSVALAVTGQLDGQRFEVDATADVLDLQRLLAMDPAALPAAPRLQIEAEGSLAEPRRVTITGQLDRLRPLPPALAALLGDAVTFAADASLANGSDLKLSDVSVKGRATDLTAEAAIDLAAQDLQARFGLAVPRLAVLSPAVAPGITGTLRIDGEASGPLGNPTLTTTVNGRQLAFAGQRFDEAVATLRAEALTAAPEGRADLALTRGANSVGLGTGFALRNERLVLSNIGLRPGVDVEGKVAIDLGRVLADGSLRVKAEDLTPLTRFFGVELVGGIALDLNLEPKNGKQWLAANIDGSNLSGPFGAIGQVEISADIRNALADPEGEARITLAEFRQDMIEVDHLTADLQGGLTQVTFAAVADGTAREPFEVDLAGSFAPPGGAGGGRLALDRLEARYAGEPVSLTQPVTVRLRDGGFAIDQLSMAVAGGRIDASGGFGPTSVDLRAAIADLPLALAERFGSPPVTGSASATLTVTGTPQQPQAEIAATATGIAIDDPDFGDAPPLDLDLNGSFRGERLKLALEASRLFETPITATATIPLALSLQPFAASVPQGGALEGRLQAQAELSRLVSLLLLDDQQMSGQLDVDLGLTGTVGAPRLDGYVRVADGLYQNLVTGTVLTDINAAVAAKGTAVLVERLTATDGGKGTVTGSGSIDLAAAQNPNASKGGFPFALKLAFRNAVLVRYPEAVAEASGDLAFGGNLGGDALLNGEVAVGPAEIRIPDRLPPSVVDLDVIEISESGEIMTQPAEGGSLLAAEAIGLKLTVKANRIFVRGRGLESVWNGRVRVGGTAATPQLNGRLQVERGTLDLLGNRLRLTRGIISFPGAQPPSPTIDVLATSDVGDGITAEVAVRGDATSPQLVVSSTPPLPEDEVLARLLFGRDIARITPVQALKLAAAVDTLRGGGSLDLMGEARNLLGVDILDVRASDTTSATGDTAGEGTAAGTSIAAGKYLTDEVFVEVEQGLGGQGAAVSVEVEVTPNITVDTEVGANSQTGVGIKWRYDY